MKHIPSPGLPRPKIRLFERLLNTEQQRPDYENEPEAVLNSIKHHLACLLNSYPGGSESSPTLGLIDFNDATLDGIDLDITVQREIRKCLIEFEPRVTRVMVEPLPRSGSMLQLRFKVHAAVLVGVDETQATIDLLVDDRHCLVVD